jgi:hypothetical protein
MTKSAIGTVTEIKSCDTFTAFKLATQYRVEYFIVWSEAINISPIKQAIRISFLKESLINGKQIEVDYEEGSLFVDKVVIK